MTLPPLSTQTTLSAGRGVDQALQQRGDRRRRRALGDELAGAP